MKIDKEIKYPIGREVVFTYGLDPSRKKHRGKVVGYTGNRVDIKHNDTQEIFGYVVSQLDDLN